MLKNYLITAFRSMWRNKTISIINIVGLSLGFSIFLTFWVLVRNELSFDKFHKKYESIARVRLQLKMNNGEYLAARVGGGYAKALKDHYPEVLDACRLSMPLEMTVGVDNSKGDSISQKKYFVERQALAVDTNFFNIFSFQVIAKNGSKIFHGPESIVLTETFAKKLFGSESPIGKSVNINIGTEYTVSAVVKDPPTNSSIQFNCLVPFSYMQGIGYNIDGFEGTIFQVYLLLNSLESIEIINRTITDYLHTFFKDEFETKMFLEPFNRVHLYGEELNYIGVYINTVIALLMLAIACINFINLTTAHSTTRIKEVGVRKVIGASRYKLIVQFLGETFVICIIAFYIGIIIAEQLVKKATALQGSTAVSIDYTDPILWLQMGGILLLTVLISGLYPSFILSRYKPAAVFQHRGSMLKSGGRLRKLLVVIQFAASVFFIVTTLFVSKQFKYMRIADLGFTRENIFFVPTRGGMWKNYNTIHEELLKNPLITGVSSASEIPVNVQRGEINWGKKEGEHSKIARIIYSDYDFAKDLEIKMVKGRFYSRDYSTDSTDAIVVNQGIVDMMGWKEPIGKSFYYNGKVYLVIGVTDNIKFTPFEIKAVGGNALIFRFSEVNSYIFIKYNNQNRSLAIDYAKKVLEKYNPGYDFEYFHLNDPKFEALQNTQTIGIIFWFITLLGFFISTIGLFGLAIHSTNRRVKEIGIRKSFGSSNYQVYNVIVNEFLRLVLIANLIGLPIAWLLINWVFQFFTYRIDLSVWVFAFAFVVSFIIALVTIGFIAYKAARQNPVESLRYE
jgi:putative ABC transport system permease protein